MRERINRESRQERNSGVWMRMVGIRDGETWSDSGYILEKKTRIAISLDVTIDREITFFFLA